MIGDTLLALLVRVGTAALEFLANVWVELFFYGLLVAIGWASCRVATLGRYPALSLRETIATPSKRTDMQLVAGLEFFVLLCIVFWRL